MPTISACIVAYCDYEEVCAAVRSILHFTPAPDFTLYIVDNASPDGCGKQLADTDWADPRVQVLCLPENVGFGRGHNAVLGKLHSSVHFILNPDIVLTGDILQPMAEWLLAQPGAAMATPQLHYPDDDPTRDPLFRWRAHGYLLYTNWLNYYVYQDTPYDLNHLEALEK